MAARTSKQTKPKPNNSEDLFQQRITDYKEEFLLCRDLGHAWRPVTATQEKNGNIRRVLTCVRCETVRNQLLDRRGYILSNNYGYTAGYVINGTGRMTAAHRALLRVKSILGL